MFGNQKLSLTTMKFVLILVLINGLFISNAQAICVNKVVSNNNSSGPGSLRQAIINVCNGFAVTFDDDYTIDISADGELDISKSLSIDGELHDIVISGGNASRVFNINPNVGAVNTTHVTFNNLTIANGNVQTDDCGSSAVDKCGGGIMIQNEHAEVTLKNSTVTNNSAEFGSGIYVDAGTLTIERSTISGNTAAHSGGGLYNWKGTLTLDNSTLSSNSASGHGGGILNGQGITTVSNSTITNNSVDTAIGSGIGSFSGASSTDTSVYNSLISGNNGSDLALIGNNPDDSFSSFGYNLIGTIDSNITAFTNGINGDQTNITNPQLEPLSNNGGFTFTHALLPNSPAIDKSNCTGGPAIDQRGMERPRDHTCDVGSYELNACINVVDVISNAASGLGSLRQAINDVCDGGEIYFDGDFTIDLSAESELLINKSLTIDGDKSDITISGGDNVRVFKVAGTAPVSVIFKNLTIAHGKAQSGSCSVNHDSCGGGILIDHTVTATIIDSTFSDNTASYGGAIYNDGGNLSISKSTFSNGSGFYGGGGIYNWGGTSSITQSSFSNNWANYGGGGVYNSNNSTTDISNSTFSENSTSISGGAIRNYATMTINSSTFSSNSADGYDGGAIENTEATLMTINNSTFSGNSAGRNGGGLNNYKSTAMINNSTFTENQASNGGGLNSRGGNETSTTLVNTIVSNNYITDTATANDLALSSNDNDSFSSGGTNMIGVVEANITAFTQTSDLLGINTPLLMPLSDNGGDTFTHALSPISQAIDAGNCSSGPAIDQRGKARPQNTTCDIGAFELDDYRHFFVKQGGNGDCSQADPCSLQTALSTATRSGDTLFVAAGSYTGDGDAVISSTRSINILGGWDGTTSTPIVRDPDANQVIIDANEERRGISLTGSEVTLAGFTISNGKTSDKGAGLHSQDVNLILHRMTFYRNLVYSADDVEVVGGGAMIEGGRLQITNSTFDANTAKSGASPYGGGLAIRNTLSASVEDSQLINNDAWFVSGLSFIADNISPLLLRNNRFESNGKGNGVGNGIGGYYSAMEIIRAKLILDSNTITNNKGVNGETVSVGSSELFMNGNIISKNNGNRISGLYLNSVSPFTLTNNMIVDNFSSSADTIAGTTITLANSNGQILHNTIANKRNEYGVKLLGNSTVTLTNNILVGNTVGISVEAGSTSTLNNTLWGAGDWSNSSNWDGAGAVNHNDDVNGSPAFINAVTGNYHIYAHSAAKDTGIASGILSDIDGDVRPLEGGYDIGADETTSNIALMMIDVDGDGVAAPLTDGLLILRYLFSFTGDNLVSGAVSADATRSTAEIEAYLLNLKTSNTLDIDDNSVIAPLSDGLLVLRKLFDFSGSTLISGAVGAGANRATSIEIEAYIDSISP